MLSVATRTVQTWASTGRLACVRVPSGRRYFDPADLDAFLVPVAAQSA